MPSWGWIGMVGGARWAGTLRVQRERDALVGLDPDRKVVALGERHVLGLRTAEHVVRDLAELQRDLALLGRERLARPQVERHARPPPVVDVPLDRTERLGRRLVRAALLLPVPAVLPTDHAVGNTYLG